MTTLKATIGNLSIHSGYDATTFGAGDTLEIKLELNFLLDEETDMNKFFELARSGKPLTVVFKDSDAFSELCQNDCFMHKMQK